MRGLAALAGNQGEGLLTADPGMTEGLVGKCFGNVQAPGCGRNGRCAFRDRRFAWLHPQNAKVPRRLGGETTGALVRSARVAAG